MLRRHHRKSRRDTSRIPTVAESEAHDLRVYAREREEVERAPLGERREGAHDFLEAMRHDPELVAERIGWIIDGAMGRGAQIHAERILAARRMNKPAALLYMVASVKWRTPGRLAVAAWKKLSPAEKKRLQEAIEREIAQVPSARDPRRVSLKQRHFIAKKIPVLRHEGYPERQSIAIAYRMAGVPARRARRPRVR